MKKYTLVVFVVLLIFSGCNPRTNTPQSLETSSETVKSSSIESSPSSSSSSSNSSVDTSSDINSSSSISDSTKSQNSLSISSSSSPSAPAQTVIEADATTVYIELSSNTLRLDQISDSFQIPYKIINNSSREVYGSPEYVIERYNGTDWELLPYNEDVIPNWPSVVYNIPANTAFEESISFFAYDEGFISGKYRLVKGVGELDKQGFALYAEFFVIE